MFITKQFKIFKYIYINKMLLSDRIDQNSHYFCSDKYFKKCSFLKYFFDFFEIGIILFQN